jgi:hypothetical protein
MGVVWLPSMLIHGRIDDRVWVVTEFRRSGIEQHSEHKFTPVCGAQCSLGRTLQIPSRDALLSNPRSGVAHFHPSRTLRLVA